MILAVTISRDWVRSLACAVSPIVAVEVVEHIAKPMVGREMGAGSFTYPSGTVTAVAALAVAAFLRPHACCDRSPRSPERWPSQESAGLCSCSDGTTPPMC